MARPFQEVQARVRGLLAFVNTPFAAMGEVDLGRFREHLQYLASGFPDTPSSYFVGCGTGEFWSLDLAEYKSLVRAAVEEVGHRVPVLSGVGYGTKLAVEFARVAEEQGADGFLVFPPYLAGGPQEGLYQHYGSIAASTDLGVIIYNRDHAVFEPETVRRLVEHHPNVVGLKDGVGDLERLTAIGRMVGEEFLLINGMPSAEMFAKTFCGAGIRPYSPGGIEFVPEIAWVFDHALERGDEGEIDRLIEGFYRPYTELRNQVPGYGIALIKAGLKLRGRPVGGVRPPLVDPSAEHEAALNALIERGLSLVK